MAGADLYLDLCIAVHRWFVVQRVGLLGVASVPLGFVYYSTADAGTQFQLTSMLGPVVRLTMDAETSHTFGVWSAKTGLMPSETRPDSPLLSTKVWGKTFRNPIGESDLMSITSTFVTTHQKGYLECTGTRQCLLYSRSSTC